MIYLKAALLVGVIAASLFATLPSYAVYEGYFAAQAKQSEEAKKTFEKHYKRAARR